MRSEFSHSFSPYCFPFPAARFERLRKCQPQVCHSPRTRKLLVSQRQKARTCLSMIRGRRSRTAPCLELWVVDHPAGTRVVPDIQGKLHTLAAPQAPLSAHDSEGHDLLPWLAWIQAHRLVCCFWGSSYFFSLWLAHALGKRGRALARWSIAPKPRISFGG
jgi:hypothetical protein